MKKIIAIFFLSFVFGNCDSQTLKEIRAEMSGAKNDSTFAYGYRKLSSFYLERSLDTANMFADSFCIKALETKSNYLIISSKLTKGIASQAKNEFEIANTIFFEALKLTEKSNYYLMKGQALTGIGNSFARQGRHSEAVPYFEHALKIFKEKNIDENLSVLYMNLGNIYYYQAYRGDKDFSKTYQSYREALALAYKFNNIDQQVTVLGNLALTSSDDKKPREAIKLLDTALSICERNNLQSNKVFLYYYLGRTYRDLKDYKRSIESFSTSVELGKVVGNEEYISDSYFELSETYSAIDDYKNAYTFLTRHKAIEDSLAEGDSQKQLNELQTLYETEKKTKQIELLQLNANRDKWIKYSLILVAILVMVSAVMFYSRYKIKSRSNQLLADQNKIINQKNKDITDSINYANLIQKALLPADAELRSSFKEMFILFMARDIVSGDFYWHYRKGELSFFAVADCTGHGVPGAMMSTVGGSLLNHIIIEKMCYEPAGILNELRASIINLLKQGTGTSENKDGMDLALIRYSHSTNELIYAGANNPIYLVNENGLSEFKANKQPIGHFGENKPFTQQSIKINPGDNIYLFSDGFADQFGGVKGKKFKYAQLKELLVKYHYLNSEDQKQKLTKDFIAWRGAHEQVDDVLLVGIKF